MENKVYVLLISKYKRKFTVPASFEKINNIDVKIELLALAIEKGVSLDNLDEYKKIVGE